MNVVYQAECISMDDNQIVEGLLHGSSAAADLLLERFAQPLVRYFCVHLPDRSHAEDMAQEVFVRLIASLRREQQAPVRSLYSLVFTIARNLALDVNRTASRRPPPIPLESTEPDSPARPTMVRLRADVPDPRRTAQSRQEQQLLEEALRQLPTSTRELLVLRHIQGLTARDIAEIQGISEGTVWSRLHRGLLDLKAQYQRIADQPRTPAAHDKLKKKDNR